MSENLDFVQEEAQQLPAIESPYEGQKLTFKQQVSISAYWFATNFIWGALLVVMLPAEVARIAPEYRGPALGLLIGLGAVVALIIPLIVGALSDRCASKWGRRRPYIATGVAINVLGLALMCAAVTLAPTTLGGRVQSVDAATKTITISSRERDDLAVKKGDAIHLKVDAKTELREGGDDLSGDTFFQTAAQGDRIQARGRFNRDGNVLAASELHLVKSSDPGGGQGFWGFIAGSASFWMLLGGFMVAQFGNNVASAAYSGVIPDLVPEDQRGIASGYMALMTQAGTLFGAIGCGFLLGHQPEFVKYAVLAIVLAGVAMMTLFGIEENPLPHKPPKLKWGPYLKSLWINPKKYPDFAWVWITRAFVMLGFYSVLPFINYYLVDVIRIPQEEVGMKASILIAIILVAAAFSGVYGGSLSDRIGRKRVVYFSNVTIAIMTIAFIFCNSLTQVMAAGVFFGLGFGAYTSVDWALGTDVLPSKKDAAKEMAVWHIAMTMPQALAAPLAGVLIAAFGMRTEHTIEDDILHYSTNGYAAVFIVCAVLFGLGAYFLKNVRGVK